MTRRCPTSGIWNSPQTLGAAWKKGGVPRVSRGVGKHYEVTALPRRPLLMRESRSCKATSTVYSCTAGAPLLSIRHLSTRWLSTLRVLLPPTLPIYHFSLPQYLRQAAKSFGERSCLVWRFDRSKAVAASARTTGRVTKM